MNMTCQLIGLRLAPVFCCSWLMVVSTACLAWGQQEKMDYPETKKVEHVDEYFGTKVPDPYQWLEADVRESEEVKDWVTRQSEFTEKYLQTLTYRDEITNRLTTLWNYEKFGTPFKKADTYYFTKNDGLQNQSVLYRMDELGGEPEVVLDPNKWSEDGTIALAGHSFSDDGQYMAYGVAVAGSDWTKWKIKDLQSGETLDDLIEWIKFGGVAWSKDSQGFFYSRYPELEQGEELQSLNLNQKIYYHRVGTEQSEDPLVYEDPEHPEWGFTPEITEDGAYMVVTVWKGTDEKYRVYFKPLESESDLGLDKEFTVLIGDFENEFTFIGNRGSKFFFKSDVGAAKGNVLAIDVEHPERENWKVVVPEAENVLNGVTLVNHTLICNYLEDAKTQIKMYDLDGEFVRDVEFPSIGTASGFDGEADHKETFYSFSSFATPPSIFRYDMESGESTMMRQAEVDFDPGDYEVKQVFYTSKDGTRVPMFIAHKKGVELNGENPTLLYGYGGFNIPLTPGFSISRLQWMEMGGVFAQANLRGGGEYGEAWHKAGTKTQKQNVFDDFIAAAEFLIEQRYTSSDHLAIQGGSNGGLLVGACMTQRPELFGACLPAVGVMDMLKFQNWTAGRYWVDDYGSAENSAEEFQALYAYSPYHNLEPGVEYPPTLITTADHDDRVVPAHSFKFAARLQEYHSGPEPVLIRIETSAGHGAGKPTSKIIEEIADQWAFVAEHLDMDPEFPKSVEQK